MLNVNGSYRCDRRNYTAGRTGNIRFIVVHYVGATGGAEANAKYFANNYAGASAHYFVGHASEGAQIYQSVALENTAWHCGLSTGKYKHPYCRNSNSIGIEMCCHKDANGKWYIDPETIGATLALIRELMLRLNIPPENVVRHYDVTGKTCPQPLVVDKAAWRNFKAQLVAEKEGEATMRMYRWLSEIPSWAKPSVEKAYRKGIVAADATSGAISLYEVNLQPLVWMDRLGLLD